MHAEMIWGQEGRADPLVPYNSRRYMYWHKDQNACNMHLACAAFYCYNT